MLPTYPWDTQSRNQLINPCSVFIKLCIFPKKQRFDSANPKKVNRRTDTCKMTYMHKKRLFSKFHIVQYHDTNLQKSDLDPKMAVF